MFFQFDLTSLVGLKIITSLIYLLVNYITQKYALPITLANIIRLFISVLDFVILLALFFIYIYEGCAMAYAYSIVGILFLIVMCAGSWFALVQHDEVRFVLIINVFSLLVLLIFHIQLTSMGLTYTKGLSALYIYNAIYMGCSSIFLYSYAKYIINVMEGVAEKLYWVDPLIGNICHNDLALRNVCSLSLGVLNLTYIHISGGAVNIITLTLIGLGLLTNVLVGLRLIKVSGSVKLYNGFMVQIILNGYNNILTIYSQFKNKELPKAGWYAWAIALVMGLNFISPSYCMSLEGPIIDASLAGEQSIEREDGEASPTGESREILRRASQGIEQIGQYTQRQASAAYEVATSSEAQTFGQNVSASLAATGLVAAAGYTFGGAEDSAGVPNTQNPTYAELVEQNKQLTETNTKLADTVKAQTEIIQALQKKPSWSGWFKSCWKGSNSE